MPGRNTGTNDADVPSGPTGSLQPSVTQGRGEGRRLRSQRRKQALRSYASPYEFASADQTKNKEHNRHQ